MKTEVEIKKELKTAKADLKKSEKQFAKYDNTDDMEEVARLQEKVSTLEWIVE